MRVYAVIIKKVLMPWDKKTEALFNKQAGYCFSWTKQHPEDPAPSCKIYAIYPKKKDALADAKFRGDSKVIRIKLQLIK